MHALALLVLTSVNADPGTSRGVLLDFTATWCGPCQQMNPVVSRLKRQGYPIMKVDIDQRPDLAKKYNVRSIPAFVLVIDGQERTRSVGMTAEAQLKRMLLQIPSGPPRSRERKSPVQVASAGPKSPANSSAKSSFDFPFPAPSESKQPSREPEQLAAVTTLPTQEPPTSTSPQGTVDPLAWSVRIRLRDEQGVNFGSGTVVGRDGNRFLILTCGHLFRTLSSEAVVEIDVFEGGEVSTIAGELIDFDLDADVGLLSVTTERPLSQTRIADAGMNLKVNQPVTSVGCGGGEKPSVQNVKVTELNRYDGPANVECTGTPIRGRSGGGLFSEDGQVVGVCIRSNYRENRGLYAGLEAIHDLLRRCGYGHLFEDAATDDIRLASNTTPNHSGSAGETRNSLTQASQESGIPDTLKDVGNAEVICIVRPLDQPEAESRVIIINQASPRFVSYLTDELNQGNTASDSLASQPSTGGDFGPSPFEFGE
ncbi:trypsin-like peptidase domain-containing protein [Thalassoroseus pseudoceratinae]|uniref:trypsin-like peptidase domain-containing protein n=1 Tax=Thalassoroseus pseudoceratinae TaxID=2713176 RepID=UPI001420656D|nr:trypsin-like peptidase domain-containing protein [Thalassoroseus pseudoceratinae]